MVFVYVFIYQYLILPVPSSLSPSLSTQIQHFWAYLYCVHSFLVLIFGHFLFGSVFLFFDFHLFLIMYFWSFIVWYCVFVKSLSLSLCLCCLSPAVSDSPAWGVRQPAFSDSPFFPTARFFRQRRPAVGLVNPLMMKFAATKQHAVVRRFLYQGDSCAKETPVKRTFLDKARRLLWQGHMCQF